MKSVAKFQAGQQVLVGFNPPRPDLRVPEQANGANPGRGEYQTRPDKGIVLEVQESEAAINYLVEVELYNVSQRNGREVKITSHRKRIVPEHKLTAA